jgi:2-keto-4-pentenoate hydratase/2-oxohepta-3-ene-1,7-dioic acid hydratase in catechol pathway
MGAPGHETPVVLQGDRYFDLSGLVGDIDGFFWESGYIHKIRPALDANELPEISPDGIRVGAPIARPSSVFCIGMNYAAHAAESGSKPPDVPIVFHKAPNTVVGPFDAVPIPPKSTTTDWEVELGVVIGQRTAYLPDPASAHDHIAGYVTVNDLSERTWQIHESGGQWSKGKSAPGFCPVGPHLVTPDEVDLERASHRLRSRVNGSPRQDTTTADMVFTVDHLIWDLSQYMTLEPGDLICTGTPEGVALSGRFPYLEPGDVVEVDIEGLGPPQQVSFTRSH